MNPSPVRERLQSLPPDLSDVPTRFEMVRDRVRRRRRRQAAGVVAAVVLVAVAGPLGVHLAPSTGSQRDLSPSEPQPPGPSDMAVPGVDAVTKLSEPRAHNGSGTETVELGTRPAAATSVSTELTCLTPGRIGWPDGSSLSCGATDIGSTASAVLRLQPDQHELVISAQEQVGWRLRTTYVQVEATAWGVNANGDTYGAHNRRGDPDLLAVVATNGRHGYVYSAELEHASGGDVSTPEQAREWMENQPDGPVFIPVYESDGKTVIGRFGIG